MTTREARQILGIYPIGIYPIDDYRHFVPQPEALDRLTRLDITGYPTERRASTDIHVGSVYLPWHDVNDVLHGRWGPHDAEDSADREIDA